MKNKLFTTELEKNKILEMHKKAIKKEFLFEYDTPTPTPTPTISEPTPTSTTQIDDQLEKNQEIWLNMSNEEKKTKINSLVNKIQDKLKTKVFEKFNDIAKNLKMKLILNNDMHFILTSNGNPFYYDFGDHTKVLTSVVGNPKVIDNYGSGPSLPNESGVSKMLLGSSSYDTKIIANSIANELESFDKFLFTYFTFIKKDNINLKMYDVIVLMLLPLAIMPYGSDGYTGRGNLYFTDSDRDCANNTENLIELNSDFDSSKLFSVNSAPDKKKYLCVRVIDRVFKVSNNNLTLTSPDFDNYLTSMVGTNGTLVGTKKLSGG